MNARDFRSLVVRPTLDYMAAWNDRFRSAAAEELLVATAAHESGGFRHDRQLGGGPARGFFQIEPATFDDVVERYVAEIRPEWRDLIGGLVLPLASPTDQLVWNQALGCAVARLRYYMAPAPLPSAGDRAGLAAYWKRHYNTAAGAGDEDGFLASLARYVDGRPL